MINFEIGRTLLGKNNRAGPVDFAKEREEAENSAHYYVRSSSEYATTPRVVPEGYLEMSSPPPTSRSHTRFTLSKHQNGSVRYTKEPYLNTSEDIPLTSDMTVNTESTGLTDERDSRSYSVSSRYSETGPGWRSNMRGDYKGEDMKPVCTKDLLCWAYQV